MNKSIISVFLLGATSLMWSTSSLAETNWVTGVWDGTTTIVNSTTKPLGFLTPVTQRDMYVVTDVNTGATKEVRGLWHGEPALATETNACMNTVFPGICHGVKYTVTDINTGKNYKVTGVKQGTMDVIHGTRVIRYQYVTPVVKPI